MHKRTAAAMTWLLLCGASGAVECRLDQARYTEPQSGAVLLFHPKTPEYGLMTSGVFDLVLPNMESAFPGQITWTLGKNARPDASIERPCPASSTAPDEDVCWLWSGNAYVVAHQTVALFEDDEMAAPQAILFADFGRSLLGDEQFVIANPGILAFDLFTLTACAP